MREALLGPLTWQVLGQDVAETGKGWGGCSQTEALGLGAGLALGSHQPQPCPRRQHLPWVRGGYLQGGTQNYLRERAVKHRARSLALNLGLLSNQRLAVNDHPGGPGTGAQHLPAALARCVRPHLPETLSPLPAEL